MGHYEYVAKRMKSHYLGQLGETAVIRRMLDTGSSLNSLSASDYGWDLHIHLPREPFAVPSDRARIKESWIMSGRTAHIQVKNWVSSPKVNVGTLRGWVSGGMSGMPTFVVIPSSDDPSEWKYLGPGELDELLQKCSSTGDEGTVTMSNILPFPDAALHHLLDLWTWNSQMTLVGRFDKVLVMQPGPERAKAVYNSAVNLAALLLTAWAADHEPYAGSGDADEALEWLDDFAEAANKVLYPKKSQTEQQQAFRKDLESYVQGGDGYPGYLYQGERASMVGRNRYSHLYTTSPESDVAYAQALEKLTVICGFLMRAH